MLVTTLSTSDRNWVRERTELLFGGETVVSRDVVHQPVELPGFIAMEGTERVGLATFKIADGECELVTLDALCQWCGVGTALLEAVEKAARAGDCRKIWLITTNDNLDSLRFFQRRGFRITDIRVNGMENIRRLKPGVPLIGNYGIPVNDEIEMEKILGDGECWKVV
ncbi:GNAT family N-acetyltransferase [bacterium]|nr:GNAT family N-acetyltransferase [bacterium]MBU1073422.1 GNAT family N-acetyltransferase [bacterium]MBU1674984.1 GNAT family N-acetyltransferase [bacterium]